MKISNDKEEMTHFAKIKPKDYIGYYHTVDNLIKFWYLVKKQEQRATFNLQALCMRIKGSQHLKIWMEMLSIETTTYLVTTLKMPLAFFTLR